MHLEYWRHLEASGGVWEETSGVSLSPMLFGRLQNIIQLHLRCLSRKTRRSELVHTTSIKFCYRIRWAYVVPQNLPSTRAGGQDDLILNYLKLPYINSYSCAYGVLKASGRIWRCLWGDIWSVLQPHAIRAAAEYNPVSSSMHVEKNEPLRTSAHYE